MELEDKLKQEAEKLIDRLSCMDPKSEDYRNVADRLKSIQEVLMKETDRTNSVLELKRDEKRLDLDNERFAFEIEEAEQKRKTSFKDRIFQIGMEIEKALLYVGGTAAVMVVSVMISNSGEVLPSFAAKFINGRKF